MGEKFEMSIEVGPIPPEVVERLKSAGHSVYRGNPSWRVEAAAPVLGKRSVRAQAQALATKIVKDFGLEVITNPPVISLRDPDVVHKMRSDFILDRERRAYDPLPLSRPKRKWWQRAMELGLGERKGD